jgi:hypothetical protein
MLLLRQLRPEITRRISDFERRKISGTESSIPTRSLSYVSVNAEQPKI